MYRTNQSILLLKLLENENLKVIFTHLKNKNRFIYLYKIALFRLLQFNLST